MKIAFVGKGGSGKTTVSALFCHFLASQGKPVLAIDADLNQHLAHALSGEQHALPSLGDEYDRVKDYLRGDNPRITSAAAMFKTTPPGTGSRLLRIGESNELYDYFAKTLNGVRLMATGVFQDDEVGIKCYHAKTGVVDLLLNHTVDTRDDFVIVDMTAGTDAVGSGLYNKFDITFLVVEPTLKSLEVYKQYKNYVATRGITLKVIGNKIQDDEDEAFIREVVGDDYVAGLTVSRYVRALDRGQSPDFAAIEAENRAVLAHMFAVVQLVPKDLQKSYAQNIALHENKASRSNDEQATIYLAQIDPEFVMPEA